MQKAAGGPIALQQVWQRAACRMPEWEAAGIENSGYKALWKALDVCRCCTKTG